MNKLLLTAVVFASLIGSAIAEEQRATVAPTVPKTVDKVAPQAKLQKNAKAPAGVGGGNRALFSGGSGTGKTLDVPVREQGTHR